MLVLLSICVILFCIDKMLNTQFQAQGFSFLMTGISKTGVSIKREFSLDEFI